MDWTRGTIIHVAGNLGASGRNSQRAGAVLCLAGLEVLVAGLVTALDWLSTLGITFLAAGIGMALAGTAFRRTATSLTPGTTVAASSPEERRPDQDDGHPVSDVPKHEGGWLDRAIGPTDMSRVLDYEIEQRKKSRKGRRAPGDRDAGEAGYDRRL